jgi:hypothetical protein|tara:strand:- start:558 stop:809 length:252 start_codon:yes stop_codon:yes gene_type:complete
LETETKQRLVSRGEHENQFAALQEENLRLSSELDIKEEECNMLAAMVSRGSLRGFSKKTHGGSENSGENSVSQKGRPLMNAAL